MSAFSHKAQAIGAMIFAIATAACLGVIPTPEPQPTPYVPPVPTPVAPPAEVGSLNYDETNGDPLTPGQTRLIALYLRDAEAVGTTQAAMEQAVSLIQQEAAAVNATVQQAASLTLDQRVAWFVWCSNASAADFPADVSDVFDKLPQGPGRVWIQVPFAEGVPLRSKDTFSGCTGGDFWAVRVH